MEVTTILTMKNTGELVTGVTETATLFHIIHLKVSGTSEIAAKLWGKNFSPYIGEVGPPRKFVVWPLFKGYCTVR